MSEPDALRLDRVTRRFGRDPAVVADVSFALQTAEFFCLLGPSGCGKTTLLNLISGSLGVDRGEIVVAGRSVTALPPERRGVGMVFQHYALFPHMSARENVEFALRARGMSSRERRPRTEEMLDWVRLSQPERDRRPEELSGGQQQRVALARAMVFRPTLLLLDEPFANLDRPLRERLREELRDFQRRAGVATLLVTHDREEALSLGDRLGVMRGGRVLQIGSPEELYERPGSRFVAQFLGEVNFLPADLLSNGDGFPGGAYAPSTPPPNHDPVTTFAIRPERVRLGASAEPDCCRFEGRVVERTFAGGYSLLTVELKPGLRVRASPDQNSSVRIGDKLVLELPRQQIWSVRDSDDDGTPMP